MDKNEKGKGKTHAYARIGEHFLQRHRNRNIGIFKVVKKYSLGNNLQFRQA